MAGKLADLVLLDANPHEDVNPLEDVTNTRLIRALGAVGHYFDRAGP